jgi:hypothetical protein
MLGSSLAQIDGPYQAKQSEPGRWNVASRTIKTDPAWKMFKHAGAQSYSKSPLANRWRMLLEGLMEFGAVNSLAVPR